MDKLVNIWGNVGSRKQSFDDDAIDRLSHRYTVVLLVCFALVITSYVYVGKCTRIFFQRNSSNVSHEQIDKMFDAGDETLDVLPSFDNLLPC